MGFVMRVMKDALGRWRVVRGDDLHAAPYKSRADAQASVDKISKGLQKFQSVAERERTKKYFSLG